MPTCEKLSMVETLPCECVLDDRVDRRRWRLFGLEPRGPPRSCWASVSEEPGVVRSVVDRLRESCTAPAQARFRAPF